MNEQIETVRTDAQPGQNSRQGRPFRVSMATAIMDQDNLKSSRHQVKTTAVLNSAKPLVGTSEDFVSPSEGLSLSA